MLLITKFTIVLHIMNIFAQFKQNHYCVLLVTKFTIIHQIVKLVSLVHLVCFFCLLFLLFNKKLVHLFVLYLYS